MTPKQKAVGFAIGWAGMILFATIASTSTLTSLSLQDLFQYDKAIHAILFGVQTWLLAKALLNYQYKSYSKIIWLSMFISSAYGLLTEVLQGSLTTTRTFDYADWIADTIGCVIAALVLNSKKRKGIS
jgi:type IV secretory pathway TrbD component